MRSWIHVFVGFLLIDTSSYAKRIKRHGNEPNGCDDGEHGIEIDLHGDADWKCAEDKWSYNDSYIIDKMCYDEESAYHVCIDRTIDNLYKSDIPHSGPHRKVWAQYGEYNYLPPGRYVHNLEHGGVVFMYHSCAPANVVDKLRQTAKSCLYRHIVTSFPKLTKEYPFAVLTYGCIFRMSRVGPNEIKEWIRERFGKSPEADVFGNGKYNYGLLDPSNEPGSYDYNDETKPFCPDVPLLEMNREESNMQVSEPEQTTLSQPSLGEEKKEYSYESVGRESNNVFATSANDRTHLDTAWMNPHETVRNWMAREPYTNMPDTDEESIRPSSPHHDEAEDSERNELKQDNRFIARNFIARSDLEPYTNMPDTDEQSIRPSSPHHDEAEDSEINEINQDGHFNSNVPDTHADTTWPSSLHHGEGQDGYFENSEPYPSIKNNEAEESISNAETFHTVGEPKTNFDGSDDAENSQDYYAARESNLDNDDDDDNIDDHDTRIDDGPLDEVYNPSYSSAREGASNNGNIDDGPLDEVYNPPYSSAREGASNNGNIDDGPLDEVYNPPYSSAREGASNNGNIDDGPLDEVYIPSYSFNYITTLPSMMDNVRGSKEVTHPGTTDDSPVSPGPLGSLLFWVVTSLCCFFVGLLLGVCAMNCKARSEGDLNKYKVWSDRDGADSFSISAVVRKIPNTFTNRNSNDKYQRLEANEQSSDDDNVV